LTYWSFFFLKKKLLLLLLNGQKGRGYFCHFQGCR